jgi:hypothetical protein
VEETAPINAPVENTVRPEPVAPQPAARDDGGAVYYKNCTEARAVGAAPLHQGEPGYRAELDRDGDGLREVVRTLSCATEWPRMASALELDGTPVTSGSPTCYRCPDSAALLANAPRGSPHTAPLSIRAPSIAPTLPAMRCSMTADLGVANKRHGQVPWGQTALM